MGKPPHDYVGAIADAARQFVEANRESDGGVAAGVRISEAFERLAWMVDAEQHGWDPRDYVPERMG